MALLINVTILNAILVLNGVPVVQDSNMHKAVH